MIFNLMMKKDKKLLVLIALLIVMLVAFWGSTFAYCARLRSYWHYLTARVAPPRAADKDKKIQKSDSEIGAEKEFSEAFAEYSDYRARLDSLMEEYAKLTQVYDELRANRTDALVKLDKVRLSEATDKIDSFLIDVNGVLQPFETFLTKGESIIARLGEKAKSLSSGNDELKLGTNIAYGAWRAGRFIRYTMDASKEQWENEKKINDLYEVFAMGKLSITQLSQKTEVYFGERERIQLNMDSSYSSFTQASEELLGKWDTLAALIGHESKGI